MVLLLAPALSLSSYVDDRRASAQASDVHADTVSVIVDAGQPRQVMEGFGATTQSLVYGARDNLSPGLRARAIDAAYSQVRLTMGTTASLIETPSGRAGGTNDDPTAHLIDWAGFYSGARNDNPEPNSIDWSGFNDVFARPMKESVIDLAQPLGFDNYMLGPTINSRNISPWLGRLRASDYQRYIDEAAEQVLATQLYWRDRYGIVPRYHLLFNEPLNNTGSLLNGTAQDMAEIVKRAGSLLRATGFDDIRFVVPSDVTEQLSLESARVILQDPEARQYVGAVAYHPYRGTYNSVPRILATSGTGRPDPTSVEVRHQIRDLAAQYGVSTWMTEVSGGDVGALSYESFLGRSIHIHDELQYADASAYFGMESIWDKVTHDDHFRGRHLDLLSQEGTVVLVDNPADTVYITGMGRAIGHYARWLTRGAVRLQADSNNPLVLASAFRDDTQGRLALVLINCGDSGKRASVSLNDVMHGGTGIGEQSTPSGYWQPLADLSSGDSTSVAIDLPGRSVTTIAFPLK